MGILPAANAVTVWRIASARQSCDAESMQHGSNRAKSDWDRFFEIAASGVAFASGGGMIGTALGGPGGGLVGGTVGAVSGAAVEIISQKRHAKAQEKRG